MNPVNALGIKVVVVTGVTALLLFGAYWGVRQWLTVDPTPEDSPDLQTAADRDTDQDGLSDLLEGLYGTDPNNADSDGDGILDGIEISQGSSPTLSGEELLASVIQQNPAVLEQGTHTQQYLSQLPADLEPPDILNRERIDAFIQAQESPLLVDLPAGTIKTTPDAGAEAIAAYLAQVSAAHNPALHTVTNTDIEQAFQLSYVNQQPQPLAEVVQKLETNVSSLAAVSAPAEVVAFHTQLLQAATALLQNVKQLQAMQEDFVGGLIAAHNIERLAAVFQDIAVQTTELETKYGLE